MPAMIPAAISGVGAIAGLIGQRKQNKQQAAWTGKAMGSLGAMGDTGLANMNRASGAYEGMLQNPEQWTAGTAAQLGQQTQQQLGGLARTVGRSGMAGASARNLLTENTKNNLQTQLQAKLGALGGMTNLAGLGENAFGKMLGGSQGQGYLNLAQNQQSSDIFGKMGGSLYDIFSGMGKGGKLPGVGMGGGTPFPGVNVPS